MHRFLILSASALVLFVAGWSWLAFFPALPADLGGVPSLDSRALEVRIPVGANDSVNGWWLRGRRPALVLLLHGHGRTHERMWRYGWFLHRAGYGVLAIDFRSSRWRDRKPTTLGHYELEDAQAALDWARRTVAREGEAIALLGESLGGSVALALAAANPDLAAVVDDSGFETGERALEDAFERWARLPGWPAVPLVRALARAVTGYDPGAFDVRPAAAALGDRRLLFIHGLADRRISPEQTRALWRAAGGVHPLWLIAGAGHNEGWKRAPRAYEHRVLDFFDRSLIAIRDDRPAAARGMRPAKAGEERPARVERAAW